MTEQLGVPVADNDPTYWTKPQAPTQPKEWLERKKELDTTLWPNVRNLATIGHKRMFSELGEMVGLIAYHEMLKMRRDEVKLAILDHELKLNWILPPVGETGFLSVPGQQMTIPSNPEVTAIDPEVQPQPPTPPGRKRRSVGQVAPPPVAPQIDLNTIPMQEMSIMSPQPLTITPLLSATQPMNSHPGDTSFGALAELKSATGNLQSSIDKIGKMVAEVGNNADAAYKLSNTIALRADALDKKMTLILTALHHLYMSNPNTLALLEQAGIDPKTITTLGNFTAVVARFAGIQYP